MANNFDSNITRPLARVFTKAFESSRVMSKNVDTQLLAGRFDPSTGTSVDFKRPTDYTAYENATGDLSAHTADDITTGKATGTVQNYITVYVNYDEADEALKMDQAEQLLAPMAKRAVTQLELNFSRYMMKNSGLLAGTYGTAATTWDHIADAGAVMQSSGVPMDDMWCYAVNPYTQRNLASNQRSLGAGGVAGGLVDTAHQRAVISENFAGMKVMTATTLANYTSTAATDRVGALSAAPIATYVAAKDSMTQTLAVDGMGAFSGTVPAGSVIQITGLNRLNLNTREVIVDDTGSNVEFTAVVVEDATLTAGAGNLVVSGPAIFEASGAYNTVDAAPADNDVVTILGGASTLYQPNLFWHKQAFSIGSVPIKKLYSTDTLATTEDGMQIRVSKFSDGVKNQQKVRFDLRPAFATLNPFFAGQGFGS